LETRRSLAGFHLNHVKDSPKAFTLMWGAEIPPSTVPSASGGRGVSCQKDERYFGVDGMKYCGLS